MISFLLLLLISTFTIHADKAEVKTHMDPVPENIECFLGADTKVGIFEISDDKPRLVISFNTELRQIPIYLIKDSNVGIYGAVTYLLQEMKDKEING